MKNITNELSQFLNSAVTAYVVDLFRLNLKSGATYFFCSGDKDIYYDGNLYEADMFICKRNQVKLSGAPTIDTLTVTLYDDEEHNTQIGGKAVFKAAYEGELDDALMVAYRAYVDTETDNTMGALEIFQGRCETSTVSGLSVQITVKSEATGLNDKLPPRIYAAQSAYYTNSSGTVVSSSSDEGTMMIPLKPASSILSKVI